MERKIGEIPQHNPEIEKALSEGRDIVNRITRREAEKPKTRALTDAEIRYTQQEAERSGRGPKKPELPALSEREAKIYKALDTSQQSAGEARHTPNKLDLLRNAAQGAAVADLASRDQSRLRKEKMHREHDRDESFKRADEKERTRLEKLSKTDPYAAFEAARDQEKINELSAAANLRSSLEAEKNRYLSPEAIAERMKELRKQRLLELMAERDAVTGSENDIEEGRESA